MITIELSPPAQQIAAATGTAADVLRSAWRTYRDRPRAATVTAIRCPACRRWQPPRRFRRTAAVCRDCH